MKPEDKMREALLLANKALKRWMPVSFDKQALEQYHQAIAASEQALSHVNETPKNEHDSGDVLKPAPMVRLSAEEVSKIENRVWANTIDKGGLMALFIQRFSSALQDAMIKKNGGS